MLESLMEFWLKLFGGNWRYSQNFNVLIGVNADGSAIYTRDIPIEIFGSTTNLGNYLSFIASLISLVFIVILCCLFVWKIIKLIGNLIK